MDLNQSNLLAILAAVLIADVLVVVFALAWTRFRNRRNDADAPIPVTPAARPAAATSAMTGRPYPATAAAAVAAAAAAPSAGAGNGGVGGAVPDAATDPLTGLLTAATWGRIVIDEEARIRRYHRPATIVVIEVEGLDRLVTRLGPSSLDRIVPAIADTLRRGAREADHVARLTTGRFAILMPETDEILAINYVERVRKACDLWLESGAVSLRMAIGWASSSGDGSLVDAEALATDRMYGELRRAARSGGSDPGANGGAPNGGMAPAFEG